VNLPVLVAGGLGLLAAAAGIAWWLARRRAAASLPARLRKAADDVLEGVLVPNADAGQIHLEFALLTRAGLVVVDVRDVSGNVFGSETMQEWTVLDRSRRFTFANPLPPLYDRVAAVRRIVPDLPVRGVVAFTAQAAFTKGFPPNVVLVDSLLAEIAAARASPDGPAADALQAGWAALRAAAASG
jgi:hypothetical protein